MERRGHQHAHILKTSTKFIFITNFNNKLQHDKAATRHRMRIIDFLNYPTYANALIIDVVGIDIEVCSFK